MRTFYCSSPLKNFSSSLETEVEKISSKACLPSPSYLKQELPKVIRVSGYLTVSF